MSKKQWGHGYWTGREDGYNAGWSKGFNDGSASDNAMGLVLGLGAAAVAGIAGFIAGHSGRNNYISYKCRRCGSTFEIPQGRKPLCPYCFR